MSTLLQHVGQWLIDRAAAKSVPPEIAGAVDSTYAYADVWNSQAAPSDTGLVKAYRGTAFACANLCAQGVAATPLRLYVTTGRGQARPKCAVRPVSSKAMQMLSGRASISQKLVQADDVEEVVTHPLIDLLDTVNAELDSFTLMELTDLYMEVVGSAYWWIPRNQLGIIETIWILPAQNVSPEYKNGELVGYEYGAGKSKAKYSPDVILPFHMPNLVNPYYEGLAPLRAAYEAVHLEEQVRAWQQSLMDNNARPDVIVSPKNNGGIGLGPDEAERLDRRFNRKWRQTGQGRAMVVSDEIEVKTLTIPPKDAEAALMHGLTKEDIANAFGVPMSLLQTKDVNRANAEAGHYQLARNAILPRCRRLEQRLTQRFAMLFDPRLFLAFDDPVPESRELALAERSASLANGLISINEGRQECGREPIPEGDVHLVPSSQVPLSSDPPAPPAPPPSPPEEEPDEDDDEDDDEKRVKVFDILCANACREMDKSAAIVELTKLGVEPYHALDMLDLPQLPEPEMKTSAVGPRRDLPQGTKLREEMKVIFREQKKETLRHFKMSTLVITKAGLPLDAGFVFDADKWTELMRGKVAPIWGSYLDEGIHDEAKRLAARVGEAVPVLKPEQLKVLEAVDRGAFTFCDATNATTKMQLDVAINKMRQEIAEGLMGADGGLTAMTKRVNAIFDGAEGYRAERIARTEASNAIHLGEAMEAGESGVVRGFRPLISGDACPICVDWAAENPEIGLYEYDKLPTIHPNCVCSITDILIDEAATEATPAEKPKTPKKLDGVPLKANGKPLTDADRKTIMRYTGLDHVEIVQAQLGKPLPSWAATTRAEALKQAKQVENVLKKLPGVQGSSYRGMKFASTAEQEAFLSEIQKGSAYRFNAFQSATSDKAVAKSFMSTQQSNQSIMLQIDGKSGRAIAEFSRNKNEAEILFMKNATFKVVKIKGNVVHLVEM